MTIKIAGDGTPDFLIRTARPVVPITQLRKLGASAQMIEQIKARLADLMRFNERVGIEFDASGKRVLRASDQRKLNAKLAEFDELNVILGESSSEVTGQTSFSNSLALRRQAII